jgi:hypothetical protein
MRTLIYLAAALSLALGCKNERTTDADPCTKAVANAQRLVKDNAEARSRYGERPLSTERCRDATAAQLSCIAYASDWQELEGCSPKLLGSR